MFHAQTGFGFVAIPVLIVLLFGFAIIRKMGWIRVTNTQFTLIALAITVAVMCGGAYLFAILLQ
jgi:hypothetical protein